MSIFLILTYISLCAAQCVPEELVIQNSNGERALLEGIASHQEFFTTMLRLIGTKVQAAMEYIFRYSKIDPIQFLAEIDAEQYLFLQMLYSLSSKDFTYTNILLEQFKMIDIKRRPILNDLIRTNLNVSSDTLYRAIESLVHQDFKGALEIPEVIIEEIFLQANKSDIFLKSCMNGDIKMVLWLLQKGIDFDLFLPFHMAWENGKWETAKILIRHGALRNVGDRGIQKILVNATLMQLAAAAESPETVSALLKAGAPVNDVDEYGRSPLHIAVENNDTATAEVLLSNGANVHKVAAYGNTPLHAATMNGALDVVKLLFKHNASVRETNDFGLTPLDIADHSGIFKTIRYLLNRNIKLTDAMFNNDAVIPYVYLSYEFGRSLNNINTDMTGNECEIVQLMNIRSSKGPLQGPLKNKLLQIAIDNGIPFLAQCLTNLGADINFINGNNQTLLFNGVIGGSFEVVRLLINEGVDDKAKDVNGTTALHIAAEKGLLDIVSVLLKRGADIDAVTDVGFTALHLAAKEGHLAIVDLLLNSGINITDSIYKGGIRYYTQSPLHLAASYGHLEVVKNLMYTGNFTDDRKNERWTTLHSAAYVGNIDIVNFLLDVGYNVNARDEFGRTPLFWSAVGGRLSTASRLLTRGAMVHTFRSYTACYEDIVGDSKSYYCDPPPRFPSVCTSPKPFREPFFHGMPINGETPLHVASMNGHLEFCKLLISKGVDKNAIDSFTETPLMYAAKRGRYDVTNYLLEIKVSKNAKDEYGNTALHKAAQEGHDDIIELLIRNGMNMEDSNNVGERPLHLASKNGHVSSVQTLIDKSAEIDPINRNINETPLSLAIIGGHFEIAQLLLNNGANTQKGSTDGLSLLYLAIQYDRRDIVSLFTERKVTAYPSGRWTPLHYATLVNLEMVQLLLNLGFSKYTAADDGTVPLFQAIEIGDVKMVELLFDVTLVNNTRKRDKKTCLHMATIGGNKDIIKMLLDKSAYVNAVDAHMKTPLHYAANNDDFEATRMLMDNGADINIKDSKGMTACKIAQKQNRAQIRNLRLCSCYLL